MNQNVTTPGKFVRLLGKCTKAFTQAVNLKDACKPKLSEKQSTGTDCLNLRKRKTKTASNFVYLLTKHKCRP